MSVNPDRWKQRLQNLQRAQARLSKACEQESYNELELAGLIQTFEFSFELSWKTLKDLLEFEGYDVASPRHVIRTSLEARHLNAVQCETLLDALIKRNLLSHAYDEKHVLEAQALIVNSYGPCITNVTNYLVKKNLDE
ncbi:nucleotidyltransferase [Alginatibacterium sediminis]|uniref:Nucleotidyltransferase n=1 Tax=Alginatibacterium sediminis TaxID=2164068 RepID=A0A420E620_9ALTE|nr:HI0074 family nucleotidyltransferase substrate-binding subunit [Alginatibacterium sediminis]RKF13156.1 nucleotidyltransferase [Alginatibacterium sediminis]